MNEENSGVDLEYVAKLESRVEELEAVVDELNKKVLGYHKGFEVYFLLHDKQAMVDDCELLDRTFATYTEAYQWVQKYSKRKRKKKYLSGFEICERLVNPVIEGGRFWTYDRDVNLERSGDESPSFPKEDKLL